MGIMMAKDRTHAPDTSRTGAGSNTEQVAGKTTRVISESKGAAPAPGRSAAPKPAVEAPDNESKGVAPAPRWRAAAQPMAESHDTSKGAAPAPGRIAPIQDAMAGSGSADLVTLLLGWITGAEPANVGAKVIVMPSNQPTILGSSKLSQLFEAVVAHATVTDLDAIFALRVMMEKLGPVPLDKTITDLQWRTTTRVADALKRAQSTGAAHLRTLMPPTLAGTTLATRQSSGMSLDEILLRLEDLRGVIGVAIDPANTLIQTKQKAATAFNPKNPTNELERITKMGFHSVRVELDVPNTLAGTEDFLAQLVAYNAQQKTAATKLSVDLLVNFSGSINNPKFGLDATEAKADTKGPAAYQQTYALALVNDMLDKVKPGSKGYKPDLDAKVNALLTTLQQLPATATVTDDVQKSITTLANKILGGAVADYKARFAAPLSLDGVGTAFGTAAAKMVQPLVTRLGLEPSLTSVELGNEPEKQWKTPHVSMKGNQQDLDTAIIEASLNAFNATVTDPKLGAKVIPAASEWDPATEQVMIKQLNDDIARGLPVDLDAIRDKIYTSNWGIALRDYVKGRLPTTTSIPLSVHIYNSPELARALIACIAKVADEPHGASKPNPFFEVSITELQIDGVTHKNPTETALAHGIVDLGIAVMDAAAQHPAELKIGQLIAFSYHQTGNEPGQKFGLRGNNELATLIGEPTPDQ